MPDEYGLRSRDQPRCQLHQNSRIITDPIPNISDERRSCSCERAKRLLTASRWKISGIKRSLMLWGVAVCQEETRQKEEGRKEGRVKEKGEGSMATACWQFFKESVRRLTGMNVALFFPPERSFLSLKLAPFAFNYTKERSTERISHATAQDPPVMVPVFKTGRTFRREAIFVWGTRRNSIDPRGDARMKLDGWIDPRLRGPTRVVFGAFLEIECRGRNVLLSIHTRASCEKRAWRG